MDDAKYMKKGWLTIKSGFMRSKQKKFCLLWSKGDQDDPWLEFFDSEEHVKQTDKHSKHKKTHVLHNVKGIDKTSKNSTKEYCIEILLKKDKSIDLYFENNEELEQWNDALLVIVHIVQADGSSACSTTVDDDSDSNPELIRNILYQPAEESDKFIVRVEPTEAALKKRLKFDRDYMLHVSAVSLMLEDHILGEKLFTWILDFIRSYGVGKDNTSFSIYAGRRSETGEGEFKFKMDNPSLVSQTIDLKAKQKQRERGVTDRISPTSQKTHRSISMNSSATQSEHEKCDTTFSGRSSLNTLGKLDPNFQKELNNKIATNPNEAKVKHGSSKKDDKMKEHKGSIKKEDKTQKESKENKKEDKKKKGLFKKSKEKKDIEQIQSEQKSGNIDDHIYDEAVPQEPPRRYQIRKSPPATPIYSDVSTTKENAWQSHGRSDHREMHTENYAMINKAAKEESQNVMSEPDYDETTYDSLVLSGGARRFMLDDSTDLYGVNSGRPLQLFDDNQEMYDQVDQDLAQYEDAASVMRNSVRESSKNTNEYEDVSLSH